MRARAPGKLVVSGAYAVLHGAPAIVTAVSRYVIADSSRAAERETPEVRAALGDRAAPWFDASELFDGGGKLGLGASAAILVASLAAIELEGDAALDDRALAERVLPKALDAHAEAQGGGSGIDVAASAHGGTLLAERGEAGLRVEPIDLPELCVEVWSSGTPASTPELVARVRALSERDPALFAERMQAQTKAAGVAAYAARERDGFAFVSALAEQELALERLGDAAGAPIVTDAARELARLSRAEHAIVIPSGAGGGDIVLYLGPEPPSATLSRARERLGHKRLELELAARGVHRHPDQSGVDEARPRR